MRFFLASFFSIVRRVVALDNGRARLPPMGYNTWNDLGCAPTEHAVLAVAHTLQETGLADLGYTAVNIDDCWQEKARDARTGELVADRDRFPRGLAWLAQELGKMETPRRLRLGLYTDRGTKTCAGFPGSAGYEELDARTFQQWGVDYLKEDNCWALPTQEAAHEQFSRMRDALAKAANAAGVRSGEEVDEDDSSDEAFQGRGRRPVLFNVLRDRDRGMTMHRTDIDFFFTYYVKEKSMSVRCIVRHDTMMITSAPADGVKK